MDWDTEFTFNRDETIVLKRDVLPYFEDIEDYAAMSKMFFDISASICCMDNSNYNSI